MINVYAYAPSISIDFMQKTEKHNWHVDQFPCDIIQQVQFIDALHQN